MTKCFAMFAVAFLGQAAMTVAGDVTSSLAPTEDGRGVAACVSVNFGDLRELPRNAVKGLWSLIMCVTQPIHPYHYVRDERGTIVKDADGDNQKVWLPFYRLWGEHQGDSVVGIVYDNGGANGIAGSHWLAGYGNSGWQDKAGKTTSLLAILFIDRNNNYSGLWHEDYGHREIEETPVVETTSRRNDRDDDERKPPVINPEPPNGTPDIPPITGSDGEGGPVGW